ncbi:MAG: hypothetical protein U9R42_00425 [Bacteroidota bacterium]|nr:hypothetical protein [Bacteroidota bacterium]
MDKIKKYIPKVTKRALLFISGLAWFLTSIFLIVNSISGIFENNYLLMIRLAVCVPTGLLAYYFIFRKIIVIKYLDRIVNLDSNKPYIFSFMGTIGYLVFIIMATLSFSIEIYKLIKLDYLFTFQSIMSVPVLLTSLYFFRAWKTYESYSTPENSRQEVPLN